MRLRVPGGAGAPKIAPMVDEREILDPWGLGLTMTILRNDHPDWVAWLRKHADNPFLKAGRLAHAEASLAPNVDGFRKGRSADEMSEKALSRAASKLVGTRTPETILAFETEMKRGVAEVLWKTGKCDVFREDDGAPFDLSIPEKRFQVLSFEKDADGRPFKVPDLRPDGSLSTDPRELSYLGDAIYALILEEADKQAAFAEQYLQEHAVDPLGSTPAGSTASG